MANIPMSHATAQVQCHLNLSGSWTLRKYEFEDGKEIMDLDRPLINSSSSAARADSSNAGDMKPARSQSVSSYRTEAPDKDANKSPSRSTSEKSPGITILQQLERALERDGRQISPPTEDSTPNNAEPGVQDLEISEEENQKQSQYAPSLKEPNDAFKISKEILSSIRDETTTTTSPTKKATNPAAPTSGKGWKMVSASDRPKALYDQPEIPDITGPRARRTSTLNNSKFSEAKREASRTSLAPVDEDGQGLLFYSFVIGGLSKRAATPRPKATKGKGKGRGKDDAIEILDDEMEEAEIRVPKKRKTAVEGKEVAGSGEEDGEVEAKEKKKKKNYGGMNLHDPDGNDSSPGVQHRKRSKK
ncbi:uncharacterized protein MYCFIDRAFT_75661 [Pseudocercospora fijiensis CIRAD86]|uniref:Uncharacterized protein n=1 Tax=Pseudocercospora fijiensis (strain CIRAD86) TaxID=383855 RepID=N1QA87_PSEFD|nr:uncharacterized protein MYCFIDRAFT_75661 [Pseudocercospora fijiensis CIRAD86]EME87823.1 hypothetical protein MYCFIDRAFT_75661 [Pseudocercospora fijiensis CIRAD86]